MKSILLTFCTIVLGTTLAFSQTWITSVASAPNPATACDSININIGGNLATSSCSQSSSHTISGSTITIDINVTCGGIGLPIVTPYNEVVNLGMIPMNNYTVVVNQYLAGSLQETNTSNLVVTSCCNAVSSFGLANPSNCIGDTTSLVDGGSIGISFVWADNGSTFSPTSSALGWIHTFATSGVHNITLTAIDSTGCEDSSSVSLTIHDLPVVTMSSVPATCATCVNGEALATVVSGPAPHQFIWNVGGTSNPLTGLNPGNYSVTVTDGNQCSATEMVTVGNSVGLEELNITSLNIYPNPSYGQINIDIQQKEQEELLVEILDLTGKLIETHALGNELSINTTLDLSLAKGNYLMKINNSIQKISIQ